ncbi:hypothetical protein ACQ3G6_08280, partial [Allorhizobium undicola]|uniref:hypothetical protein n=1 Tax=Allorhizobium undicola TaxID=78527 RepID=UPI003D34A417
RRPRFSFFSIQLSNNRHINVSKLIRTNPSLDQSYQLASAGKTRDKHARRQKQRCRRLVKRLIRPQYAKRQQPVVENLSFIF